MFSEYKQIIVSIASKPYWHFILSVTLLVCPLLFVIVPLGDSSVYELAAGLTSITRTFSFALAFTGILMVYQKSVVKKYKDTSDYYLQNFKNLQSTSWENFKKLVVFYFRKINFSVSFGNDRYSFIAEDDNFIIFIDCKHWDKEKVHYQDVVNAVRKVEGKINYKLIYIVTKGKFSERAQSFAYDKKIKLISGFQLVEWMKIVNE